MTPAARTPKRRNETRQLVMPIMAAVNSIPGVRVWRPHVLAGAARDVAGAGLAVGSADLIGVCRLLVDSVGRFFCLEVKQPGKWLTEDQELWASIVRGLGGFHACVHSVEEALTAITRCRAGERS
jgi:hypothetical protein